MRPHEFFELSFPEVCLMMGGYDDRKNVEWKQTREIAYLLYCLGTEPKGRDSKQKFMPLKGDGKVADTLTPSERIQAAKEKWEKIRPRKKKTDK